MKPPPPYNLCLFNFRTRFQKRLMYESRGLPVKGKEVMKRKHISLYSCSKKITLIFSFFQIISAMSWKTWGYHCQNTYSKCQHYSDCHLRNIKARALGVLHA